MEELSYLGIDWGKADIGVALADPETRIAFVLTTIHNDTDAVKRLADIIEREHIGTVVIGLSERVMVRDDFDEDPENQDEDEPEEGGRRLGALLSEYFPTGLRVVYQNEMFTTKMAQRNLIERGMKRRVSKNDDAESARIILQSWLEGAGRHEREA